MGRLLTLLKGVGGGAAPAFAPDDISGLLIWLDLSDTATVFQDSSRTTPATVDGDPVGGITDKSGTGRHHTQATASKRPTLRKAAQNSLDVIEFDGSDDTLQIASATAGTAATVFLVVRIDADPPPSYTRGGLWCTGTDSSTLFPYDVDSVIYDHFATNSRKYTVNPATTLAQWNLYEVCSKSGGWTNRLNGTQLFTTATNTVAHATTANYRLGSDTGGTVNFDGRIAEYLWYDSELSAGDSTSVRDYLKAKWGTP